MRPTVLEIDKNKFKNNIKKIREYAKSKELLPIIKANAYGTYLNKELDIINMFNIVGVAIVSEGVELRNIGYKKDILVINEPGLDETKDIVSNNLIIGLSSKEFLDKAIKEKLSIRVHLEIETGMNRTGIKIDELEEFCKNIKKSNIIVEGIYSHLSSADDDKDYTNKQLDTFKKGIDIVKKYFDIKYIHIEASNGLLNYNVSYTNLIRPGIIMYGYESFKGSKKIIDTEEVAILKSRITFIKEIDANESVSYNRRFISKREMKVATIPIGYADGFRRSLSNTGEVVINGKKAKILGSICMDSLMVDVTNISCKVNDEVYLWDNKNITLDDIAKECNTINYEILCTIGERVPRVFIGG
jgi:alanine racemase